MTRRRSAFVGIFSAVGLALLACMAMGCGGNDSADHSLGQPSIPATFDMIDDFEMPAEKDPPISSGPFQGAWYSYDDGTPAPNPIKVVAVKLDQSHVTTDRGKPSTGALHMSGGPFSGQFGSGATGKLAAGQGGFLDARPYQGVMFWAKKGADEGSSNVIIRVQTYEDSKAVDLQGIPADPNNPGVDIAPACHEDSIPGTKDQCEDSFSERIQLHSDWNLYVIPFSELSQEGYGYKPPGGFDKARVLAIHFDNKAGEPVDEFIDDIAFFK